MSSPKKRIDILVPCHSYLNKSLQGAPVHPPVFLFLYNTKRGVYERINITDVGDSEHEPDQGKKNLKMLENEDNIYIKFIDTFLDVGDEDAYQLKTMEQLENTGLTFDYIFPIHCPGQSHMAYRPFLKPTGKLLELDARVDPHFVKTRDEATQTAYRTKIITARSNYTINDSKGKAKQIEFNKYMESHEPYVYKEALDHEFYYGGYIIHTALKVNSDEKKGGKRKSLKKRKSKSISISKSISQSISISQSKNKRKSTKRGKRKTRR
jgi:hypothetical protein